MTGPGAVRIGADVNAGRIVERHDDVAAECRARHFALRRPDERTETGEGLDVVFASVVDLHVAAAQLNLRHRRIHRQFVRVV